MIYLTAPGPGMDVLRERGARDTSMFYVRDKD